MRRWLVLGAVVAVGVLSLAVTADSQEERVVEVERLRDNLFVLRGGGGNSAAFVTEGGVVLVDTKLAGWGQVLMDAVRQLTPNPVTTVINTHAHTDHVSGNVEFPASVDIVAHENSPAIMQAWRPTTGSTRDVDRDGRDDREDVFRESGGRGLPTRTFRDRLTIGSGADRVELFYFGRGHTSGDAWVLFPALRVVHAGDLFPGKQVPLIDGNNGGSGVDYPGTLQKALATFTDVDTVITGHDGTMTRADLQEFGDFMAAFVGAAREAKAAGRSASEFAGAWQLPDRFAGYGRPGADRLQPYVQVIYDELP